MFPLGLYLVGVLFFLIVFGAVDSRKIGLPRTVTAVAALILFAGYFFPPIVAGEWEFNLAGLVVPFLFALGSLLFHRTPWKGADFAALGIGLAVGFLVDFATTFFEVYQFLLQILISVAAAILAVVVLFFLRKGAVRQKLAGFILGCVVGEIARCALQLWRDTVLITECGMGRYFDILILGLFGFALLFPFLNRISDRVREKSVRIKNEQSISVMTNDTNKMSREKS